jgi:predicted RNA-binding protein with PIN domain
MTEPTLYLFDGSNLLHAGGFADRAQLVDLLASFVGLRGVRGVLVFDGRGEDTAIGRLEVRFAPHADDLLERLAADQRAGESVLLVTSDNAVRTTAGQEVRKRASASFLAGLSETEHDERRPSRLADRLDETTRAELERLRRGLPRDP